MRKALQIIGIIALLLVMAGSASAEKINYNLIEKNDESYTGPIQVIMTLDTEAKTIDVALVKPTDSSSNPVGSIKTIYVNVESKYIASTTVTVNNKVVQIAAVQDGNNNIDWALEAEPNANAAGFGTFLSSIDRTSGDQETIQHLKIQLIPEWNGQLVPNGYIKYDSNGDVISGPYIAAVHVTRLPSGYGATSIWVACGEEDVIIPEFPTIALPVAAILGLAFVFMRRKN